MAAKFKRFLKKDIVSGKEELPEELLFLSKFNFFAVAEQRLQGVREWYVELQGARLKSLLDAKKKLNAARLDNRNIAAENYELQERVTALELSLSKSKNAYKLLTQSSNEKLDEMRNQKMAEADIVKNDRIRELEGEVTQLRKDYEGLELNYKQLLKNIDEDGRPDRFKRSPKSSVVVMQESGAQLNSLALQGGAAGLMTK
ncbi:hypothetical protein H8K33_08665 [Undibacterium amnicola]|uniref:Uncharacterized protein n=1 Tax=Undibacterium amnicola TaxID=1834038 RepID=A0ABR6XPZ9_9BURK|nr:hypothetical protein [Undibacterium amnicola]MBC3831581.1 hypothetical protein [Undibacterium amnicola]